MKSARPWLAPPLLLLAACGGQSSSADLPGDSNDSAPFAEIGPRETVRFTGNEPFWGGQVSGTALTYATPDTPDGTDIAVSRFAGRGGLSWTGMFEGSRFALAVTPGDCSDGMSDRTYPFVATLQVAGERRQGCAWTERRPFTGTAKP
jgi:uncharacterized membrane protein